LKKIRLSEFGHRPTSQSAQDLLTAAASYRPRMGALTTLVTTGDRAQRRRCWPPVAVGHPVSTLSSCVDALLTFCLSYAMLVSPLLHAPPLASSACCRQPSPSRICAIRPGQKERLKAVHLLHRVPAWGTGYRSWETEFSTPSSSSASITVTDCLPPFPGQADEPVSTESLQRHSPTTPL
jgi:hypothetical protein